MKNFYINRYYTTMGTFGDLLDDQQKLFCHTVERPHSMFSDDHPCIPEGTYDLERYQSPHAGYEVWLFNNVPGRSYIEIHIDNWPSTLLGCVGLGQKFGCDGETQQWGVLDSKVAFDRFMAATAGETSIRVTIGRAQIL